MPFDRPLPPLSNGRPPPVEPMPARDPGGCLALVVGFWLLAGAGFALTLVLIGRLGLEWLIVVGVLMFVGLAGVRRCLIGATGRRGRRP